MERLTEMGHRITASGQNRQNATQMITVTNQLRDDLRADTKTFQSVAQSYGQIQQAKSGEPVSDIALMYAYMKMLDPTSVVREGEYATAQEAGGIPAMVVNAYNKLIGGGKLSGEVRTQFIGQAEKVYTQAKKDADQINGQYREIAKRAGINEDDIIINKASTAAKSAPKIGDIVTIGGKTIKITAIHSDGTFDGDEVK